MAYDNWLVAPYEEASARWDAFVDFCDSRDLDPDDPGAEAAYEEHLEAVAGDVAIGRAEARREALLVLG